MIALPSWSLNLTYPVKDYLLFSLGIGFRFFHHRLLLRFHVES